MDHHFSSTAFNICNLACSFMVNVSPSASRHFPEPIGYRNALDMIDSFDFSQKPRPPVVLSPTVDTHGQSPWHFLTASFA
jgi:hypothetical protein